MKECKYKSYDDLPLMLNVEIIKDLMGISVSTAYELMHRKDFPTIKIGNRLFIPKEKFQHWVENKTELKSKF